MTENDYYTLKEVAVKLRIAKSTVRKLILTRQLGATIIGKQYRVSSEQLNEYCKRNSTETV